MKESLGLYIHVPFCVSKCPYCDFYSVRADESVIKSYVDAVCRAIRHAGANGGTLGSVYFGGGTPSILSTGHINRILEAIREYFVLSEAEITVEANPAVTLAHELGGLRASGVNRISFGVQSAIDSELKALGRLHTAQDAKNSIIAAKDAGFENISADLMLGIPHQTRESLAQSINFLNGLPLLHISAYMLKIEQGTPFYRQNVLELCPDEDELAEMYLDCVKMLEAGGFLQYEISNFAKAGKESRHNLKYWRSGEYLGIGPSAHSYKDGRRFYLPRDINAFTEAENPMNLAVFDGDGGDFEEYAMLRLRLKEGLDLRRTAEKFGIKTDNIAKKATALEKRGLLTFENNRIALTPHGFLLSNAVTAELLLF